MLAAVDGLARDDFLLDEERSTGRDASHKFNALHDRLQIFAPGIVAFIKVMKLNVGDFARIRRLQGDPSGGVSRMSLENYPGEIILAARGGIRGIVPFKVGGHAKDKQIRLRPRWLGLFNHAQYNPIRRVDSGPGLPLFKAGIGRITGRWRDIGTISENGKVRPHFTDHADFIAIL